MKVTVENGENQQVTLTIEVEAAEVSKAVDRASKRLANRVNIPGFRKGKAPRKIVERHVGIESLMQEAFDLVAPKAFDEALKEQKIEPVTRPNIDIVTLEDGKDHNKCYAFQLKTGKLFYPRYGCGLCQTKVPCESRAPGLKQN